MTSSSVVLFQLDRLHTAFQDVLTLQKDISTRKTMLAEKLNSLKDIYTHLVKTNTKKIFLFCLDSFYFQYKVLSMEMDNMNRFSTLIQNRMYGDYYKLYNLMLTQMEDRGSFKTYPTYKELEPLHEYKMSDMVLLHHDILGVLHSLNKQFHDKQQSVQTCSDEISVGRSITSFFHTHEYENTLLREQVGLYVNYLDFYHSTQTSYLNKLSQQLIRFQQEMNDDILTARPPPAATATTATSSLIVSEAPKLSAIELSYCEQEEGGEEEGGEPTNVVVDC